MYVISGLDRVSPRGQNALHLVRAKTRHWLGKVSCLHAADSIEDV